MAQISLKQLLAGPEGSVPTVVGGIFTYQPGASSRVEREFNNRKNITIRHNQDRYPTVDVLVSESSEYGIGGLAEANFGGGGSLVRLSPDQYELLHIGRNSFIVKLRGAAYGIIIYG